MFKDMKITIRIPMLMISLALLSAMITGFIAYSAAAKEMRTAAENKMFSLLESRNSALDYYFSTIEQDLSFHAQSPLIIGALDDLKVAYASIPGDKAQYLQDQYITKNPYSTAQKDALLTIDDNSDYNQQHSYYHPHFRNLMVTRSFHDLFLFNTNGDLIYSVVKELDFATNLVSGPWKSTALGDLFSQINQHPVENKHVFTDFASYEPSNNVPVSFIGTAVFDKQGQYIGVIAFEMPIKLLNEVMQVTAGMGESGETYLVGQDLLMRSDSRFYKGRSILKTKVDTSTVTMALAGQSGVKIIDDYRGVKVFSAYAPIDFLETRWAIIAEVDESESLQAVYTMSHFLFISGIILSIVIFFLGFLLATDLSTPIVAMTKMMNSLANNDLTTNISVSERKDEIGIMANSMVVFKENAIARNRLQQKLNHMAHHDLLTGLPDRHYLLELLDGLLTVSKTNNKQLVVMFIDLDNFKTINDTMGHQAGDELLKEVARRLSHCLREEDIVSRIGGDEFIIILPELTDITDSDKVASKVLATMNNEFLFAGQSLKITASIGIASYPEHADESQGLINSADQAMYKAKKEGKNQYSTA